ncbi:uncharacterized protein OCT59_014195 [Rhizophagus irregularis]|nr:hypothetical protein GLOIN_2v1592279 [Rhizophagus irregularis DAOM 181602=DAOM 197198]EXX68220.1 hypothetical protein RirG_106970 [Rhizophagus irregularis DAOM 197198w]UZO21810.1 hypothetical protein OCT59_014195 [Rhizophagus irregularis]POG72784.1 hypothetical protein GLOIN_2v1592279 [Rhizophagus irregularis DAOM 181602=DAOM 197198]CAB4466761.1 unnamed protein product [Rhizophagus irregularis]CAB5197314.1 unnamed protein product [Rhizophagus irregularis]|eukprot:XP_025179650.1 hypothetical protein GLOIN_2v1592279 [Rhizophagus irregularis DAOM 181602=DAOM 197198]
MASIIFKIFFILSLISVQAFAWKLTLGGKDFKGEANQSCKAVTANSGSKLKWDARLLESCCVRLYSDPNCAKDEIGFSCDDFNKKLSQTVQSFQVTNC